jgi:hypothetical protein
MPLLTEPYLAQNERWPQTGRHILAQFDADSVVVYQAYRPSIGHFAAKNRYFGGEFSLNRMSWIKPNFLWMMFRCGWSTKENQEVTLAVWLKRPAFDEILRQAVYSTFAPKVYDTHKIGRLPSLVRLSACNGTPTITHRAIESNAARFNSACVGTASPNTPANGFSTSKTSPTLPMSSMRMSKIVASINS